jgi:hypothetical protein
MWFSQWDPPRTKAPWTTKSQDGSASAILRTEYHREICFPAFGDEAVYKSVFDLIPMALPLPFNHGLPVSYAMSGKITGETMIKAWNVFAGPGENSHQWINCPFFHH